jgi:serine/threonine-protein kinase RsbW
MESERIPRSLAGLDRMFAFLKGHLEAGSVDEGTSFRINLAAEEIFVNMVKHNEGSSEFISAAMEVSDELIRLELTDHDVEPFDPKSVPRADVHLPLEKRTPGGLGIHLVKSVVDRVTYDYQDREMKVTIFKRRGA